jgi:hypothetical protein
MITRYAEIELPFLGMKINDSFFVPSVAIDSDVFTITLEARMAKVRVKCIPCIYNDMTGIRVWVKGWYKN